MTQRSAKPEMSPETAWPMRRRSALPCVVAGVLMLASLVVSCSSNQDDTMEGAPTGVEKEVVRGPVTVRLRADRAEMTIADRLTLTLDVESPEDVEITLPPFGHSLDPFLIRDAVTSEPELIGDGRVRTRRTYTLEPVVSGDYAIKPMTVNFVTPGDDPADAHTVETEELTIAVKSLLPEDVAALDVADIIPPRDIPRDPLTRLWWALAGVALALPLVLLLIRRLRRRAGPEAVPRRLAHEVAYAALRELVAEDLLGKGMVKEFYRGVSSILRRYIEHRFSLHAPERTTEEFLSELSSDDTLQTRHKALLKEFLMHCDLVKFAEFAPGKEQVQQTFDSCKAFIEQTREGADTSPDGGSGS